MPTTIYSKPLLTMSTEYVDVHPIANDMSVTLRVFNRSLVNKIHWLRDGQLHRVDGPAIEYAYGSKAWFVNGMLHRTDGPASASRKKCFLKTGTMQ